MIRIFLLAISLPVTLPAQDSATVFRHAWKISYDNDVMSTTDHYYTQGTRIEVLFPVSRKNPFTRLLPKLDGESDAGFTVSYNQDCYTPKNLDDDVIHFGDRPFAGIIFLGFGRTSTVREKRVRLLSELGLGGIGPCAVCEQTQTTLHLWLNNSLPQGWQFQVSNDVIVNYSLKLEKGLITTSYFDAAGYGMLKAGTLFTNGGAGLQVRLGEMDPYFSAPGYTKRFRFWFFARSEAYGVAYNATLQGGLFNRENAYVIPTQDVKRLVFRSTAGASVAWKKLRFEFSKTYLTQEFDDGDPHSWGNCTVAVVF